MSDLFWWCANWTDEEKRLAGDPKNRVDHMHRMAASIDAFERRIDREIAAVDNSLGPIVR